MADDYDTPERLKAWVEEEFGSYAAAGAALGTRKEAVHYWIKGRNAPTFLVMQRIEELSKGRIKASEWRTPRYFKVNSNFGKYMHMLMMRSGATVNALCDTVGVPRKTLVPAVTAAHMPRQSTIDRINKSLGSEFTMDDFKPWVR